AGIRLHPRRPRQPLHHQLLPRAESQPWLALHQRETRRQKPAEVPHPHQGRLPSPSNRAGQPVSARASSDEENRTIVDSQNIITRNQSLSSQPSFYDPPSITPIEGGCLCAPRSGLHAEP